MRSLLRWTSLAACAGVLHVIGVRRLHLHDFNAFLLVVLAVSVTIVAVFFATRNLTRDDASTHSPQQ